MAVHASEFELFRMFKRWLITLDGERHLVLRHAFAVGCDRLRSALHGKQGVCRGLPSVAGGPLPAEEGVDPSVACRL